MELIAETMLYTFFICACLGFTLDAVQSYVANKKKGR
jgi:hypothetical protein